MQMAIDLILLIEHFHSREQQIANYANLLEQKKAFTREKSSTTRTALGHQHGRRFIVHNMANLTSSQKVLYVIFPNEPVGHQIY